MKDKKIPDQPAAPAATAPEVDEQKQPDQPAKVVEAFVVPAQVMGLIYNFVRKRPHEEVDELITVIKNNIKPIYKQD